MIFLITFFTALSFLIPQSFAGERATSLKKAWKDNRVLIMSHRGNHRSAPENTIPAYMSAVEMGSDFIEVDVRLSIDNKWVVYHDRVIQTRNGERRVLSSMTFNEIRSMKISGREYNMPDQTIPTLEEVLVALKDKALIYLDDKMGRPLELAEVVRKMKMQDQVVIGINDYADAIMMSEFADDVAWRGRTRPLKKLIDNYLALKPKILEINDVHMLTQKTIDRIHKAGVRIMVNSMGQKECDKYYSFFISSVGADIIQTDNLSKLAGFVDSYEKSRAVKGAEEAASALDQPLGLLYRPEDKWADTKNHFLN